MNRKFLNPLSEPAPAMSAYVPSQGFPISHTADFRADTDIEPWRGGGPEAGPELPEDRFDLATAEAEIENGLRAEHQRSHGKQAVTNGTAQIAARAVQEQA